MRPPHVPRLTRYIPLPSVMESVIRNAWSEEEENPVQELQQPAVRDGKIFVDGEFRSPGGGETLTVLDKAAQEPLGTVGVASVEDVDAAVKAARAAQVAWAAQPYDVRAGILRAAAAGLGERADEVAALIVRETGSIGGKAAYEVGGAQNELYEAAALTSRAGWATW